MIGNMINPWGFAIQLLVLCAAVAWLASAYEGNWPWYFGALVILAQTAIVIVNASMRFDLISNGRAGALQAN